jgi:chorismate dehydratase
MSILTVGRIEYLNILPVYYYFDQHIGQDKDIKIINNIPAKLNALLEQGEIDLGPISAFSYAQNAEKYLLIPDLSVSSIGKVRSIYLFSKKPIEELTDAKIALTNASATSVHLLKIILEKYYKCRPTYSKMNPELDSMLQTNDAALLIGDDAFIDVSDFKPSLYKYDLGEVWNQITGYSMTFAVWAVRKDSIARCADKIREIYQAFMVSKELSEKYKCEIVEIADRKYNRGFQFWDEYYSGLNYDLTTNIVAGLNKYLMDAYECGYLPRPIEAEIWRDAYVTNR